MDSIKEKISYCESSIIDNDSINDIIKEFEKEIEDEEKKDKISKNTSQKKIKNSLDITDKFSFLSENDNNISKYSNMSKGSTNDSKITKGDILLRNNFIIFIRHHTFIKCFCENINIITRKNHFIF